MCVRVCVEGVATSFLRLQRGTPVPDSSSTHSHLVFSQLQCQIVLRQVVVDIYAREINLCATIVCSPSGLSVYFWGSVFDLQSCWRTVVYGTTSNTSKCQWNWVYIFLRKYFLVFPLISWHYQTQRRHLFNPWQTIKSSTVLLPLSNEFMQYLVLLKARSYRGARLLPHIPRKLNGTFLLPLMSYGGLQTAFRCITITSWTRIWMEWKRIPLPAYSMFFCFVQSSKYLNTALYPHMPSVQLEILLFLV